MDRQRFIIILGMHRSGTSALAGSLQEQGLYLGKVFEQNPYNLKGNRENGEIMQLNNTILAFNNGDWTKPPNSISWTNDHSKARKQIIDPIIGHHPIAGFKDPRTLFTLDFWLDGLDGLDIKFIGSFRHPLAVAKSLMVRDNMPLKDGLQLWELYNHRLLALQSEFHFSLISFDVASDQYRESIQKAWRALTNQTVDTTHNQFFDNLLRHEANDDSVVMPKNILVLYHKITNIYQDQSL